MVSPTSEPKIVGSIRDLKYTLPQMLIVASFLMFSSKMFCIICDDLVPGVKPILLDKVGATATQIALVIGTIPQILGFFLVPLISTVSDKTRTRWGRRIPYMMFSAPALLILLQMIAWHREISDFLLRIIPAWSGYNVDFYLLAGSILLFQVAFLFPGSVSSYLIVDVIPKAFIGRFMVCAMIIGTILRALFNFFLLKTTVDHTKLTFGVFGAIFALSYILLFCFVKEGTYPPVEDKIEKEASVLQKSWDYLAMFFRECFSHKIYIFTFLCIGLTSASNICRNMFNVLLATKDIGMGIDQYGRIIGIGSLAAVIVVAILGKVVDKYNPMIIYFVSGLFIMAVNVFGHFFVYTTETFAVIGITTAVMYAVQGVVLIPLLASIFPPEKFGQFASANSMTISIILLFASYGGGRLTDWLGYRVMFAWDFAVTLLASIALIAVYREWKKYGGKNYVPPQTSCQQQ